MTREAYVSVPESVIQDIGALKQAQGDLRRSLDEGNRRTAEGLAQLGVRVDGLTEVVQTVATLTARLESHSSGLERAFDRIEKQEEWNVNHERENSQVERKLVLWQGIGIGLSLAASALAAVLGFAGNLLITSIDKDINALEARAVENDKRLDKIEITEAQHHSTR